MKNLFTFCRPLLLCCACIGQGALEKEGPGGVPEPEVAHGMIVLGDRLEDPYSVENMSKALAALYPTKADRVVLPATDLYVRFLPADDLQLRLLRELGIELTDHPVDYEIVREGDWYHDPGVPEDRITWQYAVVPKEFQFPSKVRYELLDECYIPDAASTKADGVDWAAVEREAFLQTGNGALLAAATKAESSSAKPQGRITIVDAGLGVTEGVKGVRVSCNTFVKFAHAFTDEEGCYAMSKSFASQPRYRLVFQNSAGFEIGFNLLLTPASVSTLGKGEATGLDAEITQDSERKLFSRCVVNNAGYDFYQRCRKADPSVKTPPSNLRIWLFQRLSTGCAMMMQQGVLFEELGVKKLLGEYADLLKTFLPDLTIGLKGLDSYHDIYAQALHEFAHASHFMLAGSDYWEHYARFVVKSFVTSGFVTYGMGTEEDHGYCEVGEMWAYFCQTMLCRERYGSDNPAYGLNHWFRPQIFLMLEERGLGPEKIFQVLSSDVSDREVLQKKLKSYYPEYKSVINQAFARYN